MVGVISVEKERLGEMSITEVGVRLSAVEKLAMDNGKIMKKKKTSAGKKKIESVARKMIEKEAEEDSGLESVDKVAKLQ